MPRVSLAFFTVAPIYGLVGMVWGAMMAASGDHAMLPAHAHLNLLGMVMMAVMGTFYALARDMVWAKLAWANFILSNVGVLIMIPTLAKILQLGDANAAKLVPIIATSEVIVILGLVCFFIAILSCWRAKPSV